MENNEIKFSHVPVMLNECIEGLNISSSGTYVDCTLGGAGHSLEIAKKINTGKLIAIDKDTDAIEHSKNKLQEHINKVEFVNSDFKNFKQILQNLNIEKVDGVLIDLGVSSYQIDTANRGFSYMHDGVLDMRMDKSQKLSAYEVVNTYSQEELSNIIFNYGEESWARKIAQKIIENRKIKPIKTTHELTQIIESAIIRKHYGKGNVSKKTFQAIRIEVNGELEGLDIALKDMINCLKPKGRIVVITFHSLEDRIVKNVFKELSKTETKNKYSKTKQNDDQVIELINKKPIIASEKEQKENKRSLSAKVRIAEKI